MSQKRGFEWISFDAEKGPYVKVPKVEIQEKLKELKETKTTNSGKRKKKIPPWNSQKHQKISVTTWVQSQGNVIVWHPDNVLDLEFLEFSHAQEPIWTCRCHEQTHSYGYGFGFHQNRELLGRKISFTSLPDFCCVEYLHQRECKEVESTCVASIRPSSSNPSSSDVTKIWKGPVVLYKRNRGLCTEKDLEIITKTVRRTMDLIIITTWNVRSLHAITSIEEKYCL